MSRKRAITTFLSRKSMITRLSIASEDFLGSLIASQVMPPWLELHSTHIAHDFVFSLFSRRNDDELGDHHYFVLRAAGGSDGNKEKKIENAQTRHQLHLLQSCLRCKWPYLNCSQLDDWQSVSSFKRTSKIIIVFANYLHLADLLFNQNE